jgi:hypothetical protein
VGCGDGDGRGEVPQGGGATGEGCSPLLHCNLAAATCCAAASCCAATCGCALRCCTMPYHRTMHEMHDGDEMRVARDDIIEGSIHERLGRDSREIGERFEAVDWRTPCDGGAAGDPSSRGRGGEREGRTPHLPSPPPPSHASLPPGVPVTSTASPTSRQASPSTCPRSRSAFTSFDHFG